MTTVNIYITYDGNCEEAFTFYKSVFGGEFQYIGRFKEMPPPEGTPLLQAEDGEKIMHVSLQISNETILMGSDTAGEWGAKLITGNNFSVSINTDTREEADRLFNGLSADGTVLMPMGKTFWSSYYGMFTDKFGINWMVGIDESQKI